MTYQIILGIAASIAVLAGVVPYLKDIHQNKIHPQILSWIGWGFITGVGAGAMFAAGSTWTIAFLLTNTILCLIIAAYSAIKKVGIWSTTFYDYIFFGLGVLGIILWQVLDLPVIAIICSILADLFFGIPNVIKTYRDPSSETSLLWITAGISAFLTLFAIQSFSFHELAYPLFLFLYDGLVLLLVLKIIKKN